MFNFYRVLIVDNSKYFNDTTWRLLMPAAQFEIIGPVDPNQEAATVAIAHTPDIILVDFCQAKGDGLATIKSLRQAQPETPIVALISGSFDEYSRVAVEAGATGCLEKSKLATLLRPTVNNLVPLRWDMIGQWLKQNGWESLAEAGAIIRQYFVYTGFGLVGGAVGAALAIWVVVLSQRFIAPGDVFNPGMLQLMALTILMSVVVSWTLYYITNLTLPRLAQSLNGQALQVVLVSSIATGIIESLFVSQNWGLY
jgi:CheY-like chemotaxis protein